jgi:hypothetical protein
VNNEVMKEIEQEVRNAYKDILSESIIGQTIIWWQDKAKKIAAARDAQIESLKAEMDALREENKQLKRGNPTNQGASMNSPSKSNEIANQLVSNMPFTFDAVNDESIVNPIAQALQTARRDGMEEAAKIADDEKYYNSTNNDVAKAIRQKIEEGVK